MNSLHFYGKFMTGFVTVPYPKDTIQTQTCKPDGLNQHQFARTTGLVPVASINYSMVHNFVSNEPEFKIAFVRVC